MLLEAVHGVDPDCAVMSEVACAGLEYFASVQQLAPSWEAGAAFDAIQGIPSLEAAGPDLPGGGSPITS